jgi:hypothetical protein
MAGTIPSHELFTSCYEYSSIVGWMQAGAGEGHVDSIYHPYLTVIDFCLCCSFSMESLIRKHLSQGRLTIADSTALQSSARQTLLEIAHSYQYHSCLIVFNMSLQTCLATISSKRVGVPWARRSSPIICKPCDALCWRSLTRVGMRSVCWMSGIVRWIWKLCPDSICLVRKRV